MIIIRYASIACFVFSIHIWGLTSPQNYAHEEEIEILKKYIESTRLLTDRAFKKESELSKARTSFWVGAVIVAGSVAYLYHTDQKKLDAKQIGALMICGIGGFIALSGFVLEKKIKLQFDDEITQLKAEDSRLCSLLTTPYTQLGSKQ